MVDDVIAAACEEFRGAIGSCSVTAESENIAHRVRTTLPDEPQPRLVVTPRSREEVQDIVRIARRHDLHIFPVSSWKNWGYGNFTINSDKLVTVDLSGMNRVIHVDPHLAYAVVEPGVTQGQLAEYLSRSHPDLWLDCTGAGKETSLVGNILERGFGHSPYGVRTEHIAELEVVLADGRIIRTGFGHYNTAGETSSVFPPGVGPSLDGLFVQSGFGIVTQLTMHLQRHARRRELFLLAHAHDDGIGVMIERLQKLRLEGHVLSVMHVANDLRRISGEVRANAVNSNGFLGTAGRLKLRKRYRLPAWSAAGLVTGGNRLQLNGTKREVRRQLRGLAGVKLMFFSQRRLNFLKWICALLPRHAAVDRIREQLDGVQAVFAINTGQPDDRFLEGAYWKSARQPDDSDPGRDRCGLIWLAPVAAARAEDVSALVSIIETTLNEHSFDPFVTVSLVNPRAVAAVATISFDPDCAEETQRARTCRETALRRLIQAGYPPYRVDVASMGILNQESGEYWEVVARLKAALDPADTIAPGRYNPGR